jgi:hypothetical protein
MQRYIAPSDFWSKAPVGQRFACSRPFIYAARKYGAIVEGWNSFDFLTLYQQIGMLPQLPNG